MKDFNRDKRSKFTKRERSPRRDSDRFDRRDSGRSERTMHEVTCAKCGRRCEVPFRPTGDKPVYCSDCFRKNDNFESKTRSADYSKDFEEINKKLDLILEAMDLD